MARYENWGDANFFEGGLFIMDCGDGGYEYIRCDFANDAGDDTYLFATGMIDPTDSYIDIDAARSSCGNGDEEGAALVRCILDYYGSANCGGTDELLSSAEVQARMRDYAEEYDFETDTWSQGPLY